MQISRTSIRLAQTYLKQGGFKPGAVDGISGPKTGKALERALKARGNKAPAAWKNWPRTRRLICFLHVSRRFPQATHRNDCNRDCNHHRYRLATFAVVESGATARGNRLGLGHIGLGNLQ